MWDPDARSAVVAEGLFLYLKETDVQALFREVATSTGAGTRFVFSHGVTVEEYPLTKAWLHLIGEPWLSSCRSEDLPGYIGRDWLVMTTHKARSERDLEGFAVAEKK